MTIYEQILKRRGIDAKKLDIFLHPKYDELHDPFLLPDMAAAVERIERARDNQEKITIYGDYDIDGLTATSVLVEAFKSFGFNEVTTFIPNRFVEGYGLTVEAIESIAESGANLIITVDCGSLSHEPIKRANALGVDVIVTDHHNVSPKQPEAVAVINPKRADSKYPFRDLAGVGVAFKLVQALMSKISGLENGKEKWLLDLVALGTVCDVVPLTGENRIFVFYGLKVLQKTRRVGLRKLMQRSAVNQAVVRSEDLGFRLGPRLNASGRLETARHSLEILLSNSEKESEDLADLLEKMNVSRKIEQDRIYKDALAKLQGDDSKILVVSSPDWSHGIVGIVASKLVEQLRKPVFVLQEMGEYSKGSARSRGDLSLSEAINYCSEIIEKGGGHKFAAGVTLLTKNVDAFRKMINEYYTSLDLDNQEDYFKPVADAQVDDLSKLDIDLYNQILGLEPFGKDNEAPVFYTANLTVENIKVMGDSNQHIKIRAIDRYGNKLEFLKFFAHDDHFRQTGEIINVWYELSKNDWMGNETIEAKLLHIE